MTTQTKLRQNRLRDYWEIRFTDEKPEERLEERPIYRTGLVRFLDRYGDNYRNKLNGESNDE